MIVELTRTLYGTYYSSNSTIVFGAPPYLQANNDLTLYFTDNDARFAAKVVSANANTVITDFTNAAYNNKGVGIRTPNYANGMIGGQESFNFSFSTPPNAVLQAFSTGGSSNVTIEGSTNKSNWVTLGTLPITEANGNSAFITVTTPWPYGRINVQSIAVNQSIAINKAI